jgi:hypothetical protein
MENKDIETRVLKPVRDLWASANFTKVEITNQYDDFVRGTLYFVSIYDANKVEHVNYVYAVGNRLQLFEDVKQLAIGVGKVSSWVDALKDILQSAGMSGPIALIITATICYMSIRGRNLPNELWGALTLILGFYFGNAVRNHRFSSFGSKD